MGTWTLESISASSSDLNGNVFGSNFQVKLRMKYAGGLFGKFTESPSLDWHEQFTTLWHHDNTYWKFEANMFSHKPGSGTFQAWARRYSEAYNYATGQPKGISKGNVKLFDLKGNKLGKNAIINKPGLSMPQKSEATREYLKKNGGILEVEVHDIPGITVSGGGGKHVERLLLFKCGLVGGAKFVTAMQYLNVNTSNPENTWEREFKTSSFSRMDQPTRGLTEIPTPSDVGQPNPIIVAGEYM